MAITINGDGTITGLSAGGLPDNSVTLANMAHGTDGQILTYDASGAPVALGPGTDGQILTSTGAGSPPAFEAAAGGKIIKHYEASFNGNQTYYGNGGSNYTDTYLTITFTPQKTGTVALIYVFTTVITDDAKYGFFRLKRTQGGSSADANANNLAAKGYDLNASGGIWTPVQFMIRDNTTMTAGTDRTYTVTIRTHPGSGSNEAGVGWGTGNGSGNNIIGVFEMDS